MDRGACAGTEGVDGASVDPLTRLRRELPLGGAITEFELVATGRGIPAWGPDEVWRGVGRQDEPGAGRQHQRLNILVSDSLKLGDL